MAEKRQLSFTGGEIAPALQARVDMLKYSTGLKTCKNFMVMRHGGVTNRPGTEFVAEVEDSTKKARLIPFVFNNSQTYALEFGNLCMRVHQAGVLLMETAKNITGATVANPCVLTVTGHSYTAGDEVRVSSVGGMTELNGRNFKVGTVLTANTFELQTMDSVNLDASAYTAYTSGGTAAKVYELVTPYLEADLFELNFTQSADVLTITHPHHQVRDITRLADDNWSIDTQTFAAQVGTPTNLASDAPGTAYYYQVTSVDAETNEESLPTAEVGSTSQTSNLTWDAVTGAGGYNIYKKLNGVFGFIGVAGTGASPTFTCAAYTADILDTPPEDRQPFALGTAVNITGVALADPCVVTIDTHSFVVGDHVWIVSIAGTTELNDTLYYVSAVVANTSITLQDVHTGVDVDATGYTAWASGGTVQLANSFPATGAYYQQRMVYGNQRDNTEGVWCSKSGLRKNFMVSTPLQDDDAVTFSIVGREVNAVKHFLDIGELIVFTATGEWRIKGDVSGVLTPSAINPVQQSGSGSSDLRPLVVDGSAVFVQARGSIVRDLNYEYDTQGYKGSELSIFAAHLFKKRTVVDWAYQQTPHSIVWTVRDDGVLLGMTYIREHQIVAWHQHVIGDAVESVCVIPEGNDDVLYMVVKRTILGATKRYIERLSTRELVAVQDSIFMDSVLSYDGRNTTTTTMTLSGGTSWTYDETLTLTASASTFVSTDVGNQIWITVGSDVVRCTITAYTSGTVVSVKPHKTVPVAMQSVAVLTWSRAVDRVSGLNHLEGENVSALVDGYVSANPNNTAYVSKTVTGGVVTFDDPHAVIRVGLPYISDLELLDMDNAEGKGLASRKKHVDSVTISFEESRGGWVGPDASNLTELRSRSDENYDSVPKLRTENIDVAIKAEWNSNGRVLIRQTDPLPMTVLAVVPAGYLAK